MLVIGHYNRAVVIPVLVDNMRITHFAEFYCMKTNNQHLVSFSDVVIILINGNRTCLC